MSSRVVLVTGCTTGGIGFALCEEFARQGCKVYATSRRVETIGDFGIATVQKLALDVNSDENVNKVVEHIIKAEGQIDVVVNNAGYFCAGPLIDQSMDDVEQIFETNAFAALRIAKKVIPHMARRKSGTIVNIGSVVGEIATPWNGLYCASKAALQSISDVLSMECKPFKVSVLHVAPGAVRSNISANGEARFQLPKDTLYAAFLANIMKRVNASQAPNSMPTETFARTVVRRALGPSPAGYLTLGGHSWLFVIFKWLPKSWVYWFLWRVYSKDVSY